MENLTLMQTFVWSVVSMVR